MQLFRSCTLGSLLLCLIGSFVAFAQVDTATITGTVTDPSGASIVAAEIRATNTATGLDYQASSNEAGVYVLTALPIGAYVFEVSSPGFQTVRRPNVVLNAGARARVDVEMTVGQVTEVVEVTAEVPLLES
ncbi:MAG: carboxypeptidase regulatory-like domain-containing protein, partial [bacterium]|nr:carboxypeptidase regulatory-like domain-containing protein [bacterium]